MLIKSQRFNGAGDRDRTCDLLFTNRGGRVAGTHAMTSKFWYDKEKGILKFDR